MSVRRLAPAEIQPPSFAFSAENAVWAGSQIAKYPDGRQASAVIPLLWRAQHQAGGWVPQKAIEHVAEVLGMAYIRVLEIATFYTMFNLAPVGRHFVQLCGTTPCMLRGAQELRKQLIARIGPEKTVSADGKFSWAEVECLGACCNAPMVQINDDFYEDLTAESLNKLLDDLAAGRPVQIGPQNGRVSSEPEGAITTLTDRSLYDGSVVGAWRARFEQEEKAKADAAAAAAAAQADAAKAQPAAAAAAQTPEPAKPAATRPEQKASDSPAARVAEGQSPTAPAAAHAASAATAPDQQERTRAGTSGGAASPAAPPAGQSPSSQSGAAAGGTATTPSPTGTATAQATPSSAAASSSSSAAAPAASTPVGSGSTSASAQSGGASAQVAGAASAASAEPAALASSPSAPATAAVTSPASVQPSAADTTRQALGVAGSPSGAGTASGPAASQVPAGSGGAEPARSTATRAVAYVNWEPEFTGPAMRLSAAGGEHIAGEAFASPQGTAGRPAADASARTTLWSPAGVSHWQPAFVGGAVPLLGAPVSDEHKPELLDEPRGDGPDDLKLIWGVGPKLEAMLHRLGVFHFDQIAAWTEPNLHWVDQHLETFKGRAVREQWVEQAQKLATGWQPQNDIGDKPKG